MKARVIKGFFDKVQNREHKEDEIIEVSKERFEMLKKSRFGQLVEEVKKKKED